MTVPWVGHSVLSSELLPDACAANALAAFFADQPVPGCTTQAAPISLARRPPVRLAGARMLGTLRGRLGETVGAALDTVTDLRRQVLYEAFENGALPRRVGSLRSGFASVHGGALRLRDATYVTGVRVSGWAPSTGTTRLHVRGGGALRGTVTVSADLQRISGRLGGRRFSIVRSTAATRRGERVPTVADALRAFTSARRRGSVSGMAERSSPLETSPYLRQHQQQPGRLAAVGCGRPRPRPRRGQAPCSSRSATPPVTGATPWSGSLRGPGRPPADERALRLREGRPRGAARR